MMRRIRCIDIENRPKNESGDVDLMYNAIKRCERCNWERKYDTNRDTFGIKEYSYCPVCGQILIMVRDSPNI